MLLLSAGLGAQQMTWVHREAIPDDYGPGTTFLIDLDGDAALDLFFHYEGPSYYYHNRGQGRFDRRSIPNFSVAQMASIVAGDFDGDGDVDLFARANTSLNPGVGCVLENRGAAGPIWRSMPTTIWPLMAADFNGDGKTDLVTYGGVAIASSLTSFQITGINPLTLATPMDVADYDGDGDLDILVWTMPNPFGGPPLLGDRSIWRNDGGSWTLTTPFLNAPAITTTTALPTGSLSVDLDGDGNVDCGFLVGPTWELWRNLGNGSFVAMSGLSLPPTPVVLADLDRDGDPDLVGKSVWHENTGSTAWPSHPLPFMDWIPNAIGDVDGDLDPDIVLADTPYWWPNAANRAFGYPRLLLNQEAQTFIDANAWAWRRADQGHYGNTLVIGDIDGDAFPDMVGTLEGSLTLFRNQGDGWFDALPGPDLGPDVAYGAYQLRDLDGDGDLDLLFRTSAAINNGAGVFATTTLALPTITSGWIAHEAFDADGDGDIDLLGWVTGSTSPTLTLVRSNGSLAYASTTGIPLPSAGISAWACADFDGDSDIDLLLSLSTPDTMALLRNDGTGTFVLDANGVVGGLGNPAVNLDVGDIDADGDFDVLLGRNFGVGVPRHAILRNNNGVLVEEPSTALSSHIPSGPARLGDFDGDGDLDAVIQTVIRGPTDTQSAVYCENDGTGRFVSRGNVAWSLQQLRDLDLDGDADLITDIQIETNRQWHLEAPYIAQIGTQYVLRCGSRAMPNSVAIPWMGTRVTVPVPGFGTLCIDPNAAVPLAWMTLNGESAEASVPVPYTPALVGIGITIQAALIAPDGRVHLTPAKNEIIRS